MSETQQLLQQLYDAIEAGIVPASAYECAELEIHQWRLRVSCTRTDAEHEAQAFVERLTQRHQ